MIEGLAKRMDCRFNYSADQSLRNTSHPLFKGFMVCSENFSLSFMKKKEVKMTQAWAVGFSILELSKLVMQKLYYDVIKPKLKDQVSVLMSDTDSFVLLTDKKNSDEVVKCLADVMDCSNYEPDHPFYDKKHENQVGLLKNELPGEEITGFAGIRSKAYALETKYLHTDKITKKKKWKTRHVKKCKGIRKKFLGKVQYNTFTSCLKKIQSVEITQRGIQSKKHHNLIIRSKKIAFTSFDDKRFLLCSIHSVPYGSRFIKSFRRHGVCYFCAHPMMLY